MKNKIYFENENYIFYTNEETKDITDYAQKPDFFGTKLKMKCLLAESKDDKSTTYVLINNNGIVYENRSKEVLGVRIDMLKASKRLK